MKRRFVILSIVASMSGLAFVQSWDRMPSFHEALAAKSLINGYFWLMLNQPEKCMLVGGLGWG